MDNIQKFWEDLVDKSICKESDSEGLFKIKPVPPKEFFKYWCKPELSGPQLDSIESIFEETNDGLLWSKHYNEYLLLWGEGSGKDFTCSRILTYVAYYLMCMHSPQVYFGMAEDEPIDLINVSLSGTHSKNVFFYKFKKCIKSVRDPKTGKNWFTEQGMDLRDGRDIRTTEVEFKNGIRAHSLNSQKYGGEGMNVLIAVFDEVAEFRVSDAQQLYDALKFTETSRFGNRFKLILISYMRHENDFMMYRWEKTKNDPTVYRSKKCTWEVNPNKTKEDFKKRYEEDPEDSARRFENKNLKAHENRFFQYPNKITENTNFNRNSPFMGNPLFLTATELLKQELPVWFRPRMTEELYYLLQKKHHITDSEENRKNIIYNQHDSSTYYLHLDLAKGNIKKKNDCGGLAMVHKYLINPFDDHLEIDPVYGIYVDFMIQLRGNPEINFEELREFIYRLRDEKGFPIAKTTLDGYQSLDFQQQLAARGIGTGEVSVDKSREPYNTLKNLIYNNRLDYYKYSVFSRELVELEDEQGKRIDHPDISRQRAIEEKLEYGSKDVADSVAGATWSCLSSAGDGSDSMWIAT